MRSDDPQDVARPQDKDGEDDGAPENVQVELVRVLGLRPTQLAVGIQAAREKADRIGAKKPKKRAEYFRTHPVPVVIAPDGGNYIIDHHHLCFAALLLTATEVYITVKADWSDSPSMDAFWRRMHDAAYVWLNDPSGKDISLEDFLKLLPADVTGLKDDPYRSLAASVRRAGGYEKVWTPFAEFKWGNFFRTRIPIADSGITEDDVQVALKLARSPLAVGLPGHSPDGTDAPAASPAALAPAAGPAAVAPAASPAPDATAASPVADPAAGTVSTAPAVPKCTCSAVDTAA